MTALAVCRFAHFMATALAFGASAFLWLYAPDRLRRRLSPAIWRVVAASSGVAFITDVLWLALEAASIADDWSAVYDPSVIGGVLNDTDFGKAWSVRLGPAAALVAVLAFGPRDPWAPITVLSPAPPPSLALARHPPGQPPPQGAP